jgi:hypothetical protein
MRWLDRADAEYRAMFHKKVALLAQGNRTYALSKRLKHCAVPIFETKLDAGQRILWTQLARGESQLHLLVSKSHCAHLCILLVFPTHPYFLCRRSGLCRSTTT